MESPSPPSPFPSSPSARSSTLVMTPAPLPLHRGPKPKGHLQPHVTNLPRRPRRAPVPPPASDATATSNSDPDASVKAAAVAPPFQRPTFIQLPPPPMLSFPLTAGVPQRREEPRVRPAGRNVGPAHANVPRRHRQTVTRERARCMQELGHASRVFVAFALADSEGAADKAAEEAAAEVGFGAVVRISADPGDAGAVDDKGGGQSGEDGRVLRLVAEGLSRDDGVPCLLPTQLRAARAFVLAHLETSGCRALITAPRERAIEAVAVGVCCMRPERPTLERTASAPHEDGEADDEIEDQDLAAERVHALVMQWHDLPPEDGQHDEDRGGGALRDEWRGLLSRDGIDYIAAVLAPSPPPSPPRSRSPSPCPSSTP
ncbi:hypothetical protein DFH06DRAFT_1365963 [Mycena polygramma]|nr:hypothetical protein DFH06DRAFT_1365963 [Mycena polygramma]